MQNSIFDNSKSIVRLTLELHDYKTICAFTATSGLLKDNSNAEMFVGKDFDCLCKAIHSRFVPSLQYYLNTIQTPNFLAGQTLDKFDPELHIYTSFTTNVENDNIIIHATIMDGNIPNDGKTYEESINNIYKSVNMMTEAAHMTMWYFDIELNTYFTIHNSRLVESTIKTDDITRYIHPDDKEIFVKTYNSILNGERLSGKLICRIFNIEHRRYNTYDIRIIANVASNGKLKRISCTQLDITEHEEILQQYNKQLSLLSTIYNNSPLGLSLFDKHGHLSITNTYLKSFINTDKHSDIHDINLFDYRFIPQEYKDRVLKGESVNFETTIDFDSPLYRELGFEMVGQKVMSIKVIVIYNNNVEDGYLLIIEDVNDKYIFQKKIAETEKKNQNLYNQLITIAELLPIGFASYDKDGRQTYINRAVAKLFGITDIEGHINKHIYFYDDPSIRDEARERFRKGLDIDSSLEYDIIKNNAMHYFDSDNPRKLFIKSRVRAYYNDKGEIDGYVMLILDLTEEHRRNEELQKLNGAIQTKSDELQLAIQAGNISAWRYDITTELFYTLYGQTYSGQSITFDNLLQLVHPNDRQRLCDAFDSLTSQKETNRKEIIRFLDEETPDKVKYIETRMLTQNDSNGNIKYITGTQKDITEEYELQQSLRLNKEMVDMITHTAGITFWKYEVDTNMLIIISHPINELKDQIIISYDEYCRLTEVKECDKDKWLDANNTLRNGIDQEIRYDAMFNVNNDGWKHSTTIGTPFSRDSDGRITSYVGMRQDNTELYKLNETLNENNMQLNMAFLAGNITPVVWDTETDILHISSKEAKRNKDVFDGNLNGLTLEAVANNIREDERELFTRNTTQIRNGEITQFKQDVHYDAQKRFYNCFEANFISIGHTNSGKPTKVVGYLQDITQKNNITLALKEAKKKAEDSDRLKSAFLANMSHEIRTPLNAIIGFSELLKDADNQAEKDEFWNIINNNNEMLLRLIGDILDLSKIEAGVIEIKKTEFDLVPFFNEMASTFAQQLEKKGTDVKLIIDNPYTSCMVKFDKNRLQQIITNYMTNAIKYTPQGTIKMGYRYVDEGIRFYVSDTGIGIADENKKMVFQRFEKLDEFAQGSGLGLSITKTLVEIDGGHVGFESKEGVGSTFWAWKMTDAIISGGEQPQGQAAPEDNNSDNNNINNFGDDVLVAEDNKSNYMLISHVLKGHNLTHVTNGRDAVEAARNGNFKYILMDIRMPIMTGIEATREIRKFNKKIPIIALTAYNYDTDKVEVMEAGCNAFIAKPVKRDMLYNIINKLL